MIPFIIFFISFIAGFSLIYQILGVEVSSEENDDYEGLNVFFIYFITILRNSMGDLATP
jgi:hypothetical protein